MPRSARWGTLIALVLSVACSKNTESHLDPTPRAATTPLEDDERRLCLALTPRAGDLSLGEAYRIAEELGAGEPGDINLDWNALEAAPGRFRDPDGVLEAMNHLFRNAPSVTLTLAPFQTSYLAVPTDLEGVPFDDPKLIARYLAAADFMFASLPNLNVRALSVGNEVDQLLGISADNWQAYRKLLEATAKHVHAHYPGVQVGAKLTWDAIVTHNDLAKELIEPADLVIATYYGVGADQVKPMKTVRHDLEALVEHARGREVFLAEVGYPTSASLGSSQSKQAEFVNEVYSFWDAHAKDVPVICFVWLHDLSKATLDATAREWANDPTLMEFLGTLGLRTHDGRDKIGYKKLRELERHRRRRSASRTHGEASPTRDPE